ncbi:MAG: hypothetical protein BJ554DRAFT_1217 [Olpidium bornovanus]|uniref:Uncharacterized protein n=1 Tax=Olpidium bornovanus TaxID=278681 RepID=A0A8H7ZT17_9FUNG|nr:MAG: hypothetical protein BJ554DRAFT_1217 [Olpidium bornovanus]
MLTKRSLRRRNFPRLQPRGSQRSLLTELDEILANSGVAAFLSASRPAALDERFWQREPGTGWFPNWKRPSGSFGRDLRECLLAPRAEIAVTTLEPMSSGGYGESLARASQPFARGHPDA